IERPAHHLRWNALPSNLDLKAGALLRRRGREVRSPDGVAETGAHGAAADDVHLAAVVEDGVTMAGEGAALDLEADELAGESAFLLGPERFGAREGGALVELDDPAESGLERGDGVVDRSEEHTSELQSRENLVCRL